MKLTYYQDTIVDASSLHLRDKINDTFHAIGKRGDFDWYSKDSQDLDRVLRSYQLGRHFITVWHDPKESRDEITFENSHITSNPFITVDPTSFISYDGNQICGKNLGEIRMYSDEVKSVPGVGTEELNEKKKAAMYSVLGFRPNEDSNCIDAKGISGLITVPKGVSSVSVLQSALSEVYGNSIRLQLTHV